MRKDILFAFTEGKRPRELIKKSQGGLAENGESKKVVYRYYKIYNDMVEDLLGFPIRRTCPHCRKPIFENEVKSSGFIDELIHLIVKNLRMK